MIGFYLGVVAMVIAVSSWLVIQAVAVARLLRAGERPGGLALGAWGLQVGGAFLGPLALLLVPASIGLAAIVVLRPGRRATSAADRTAGLAVIAGGLVLCAGFVGLLFAWWHLAMGGGA